MLANANGFSKKDSEFMREAFAEAELALAKAEVPVGCVFVCAEGRVFARGHNETNLACNATRHAEIMALQSCALLLPFQNKVTVYVTLEPCIMCSAALSIAGVDCIVFGARNDKFGGCGSVLDVQNTLPAKQSKFPTQIREGLGDIQAVEMLQRFYLRANDKAPVPRADGMRERLAKRQERC